MAGFVEMFQVKRIVPYLINGTGQELVLANLELNNEHDVVHNQDDVNALAEPRDGVLEVDLASPSVASDG